MLFGLHSPTNTIYNSWRKEIYENRPLLHPADKLLKKAMDKFWRNTTEKRRGELMFTRSKDMSRLLTKKSKLGFKSYIFKPLEPTQPHS